MFALVFDTYNKPLCPAGTHLGMPSMTKTSAGVVETTMTGALTASDAVCDLSEPNAASLLDGASKLIEGCDTAHCAATRRSAVDDCWSSHLILVTELQVADLLGQMRL